MASSPSSNLISECESFRSKRVRSSLMAWSIALRTSCTSTLLVTSNELSPAIVPPQLRAQTLLPTLDLRVRVRRYTKKTEEVGGRAGSHQLCRNAAYFSQLIRHPAHPCRLISLAAMWQRGKKGRIGLDQHTVQGYFGCHLAYAFRLGEGDVAGKGDQKSPIHRSPGMLPFAGKAVQDAAQIGPHPVVFNHRQSVIPRVGAAVGGPAMNNDWPPPCRRYFHLLRESLLLLLARRVVIIIIETNLTHGEHIRAVE